MLVVRETRDGDCVLKRPAEAESFEDHSRPQPEFIAPLRERLRSTVMRYAETVALVIALHLWQCPYAVTGFVIPIHINPLNTMPPGGATAHVSQERFKVIPLRTHGNPASTVMLVTSTVRVPAPLAHPRPDSVFGRPGFSVPPIGIPRTLPSDTSATQCSSTAEVPSHCYCRSPAFTITQPSGATVQRVMPRHNRKPPEFHSNQFYASHHILRACDYNAMLNIGPGTTGV